MQLLIDTATENPKSLLVAAKILSMLSAELFLAEAGPQPSINGPGDDIKLHEHSTVAAINATFSMPGAASGAPEPQDNPAHSSEATQRGEVPPDPNVVFGRFGAASVPAGTPAGPIHAGRETKDAPPAPVDLTASASPAPTTILTTALLATTTEVVGVDRDTKGIPWDARVHSETRKTNADGTWRFRRNLDEAMKNAVMTELRGAVKVPPVQLPAGPVGLPGQLPLSPEAPPVPGYTPATNALPTAPDAPPVTLPGSLPLLPGAHVGVPDAPNAPVVSITGFRDLMTKINVARSKGLLTQEQVDAACKAANVGSITELAAQPALVPAVAAQLSHFLGVAA